MKLRYRIGILSLVFILALFFFYRRIPEHTYEAEKITVEGSMATLPVVSFCVDEAEMNQTLGYTFQPEESLMRQSITPLAPDMTFQVLIDQKESIVKRVSVAVMEVESSTVVEEVHIMALKEYEDGRIYAPVILTGNYARDVEFNLRITLTTNEGKNIYYYTRMLATGDTNIAEKLGFCQLFHDSVLDYDAKYEMEKYLESTAENTGADYARVTLSDSLDVVGYGSMKPTEIACFVPTVTEYNNRYMSVSIDYWLEIITGDARETVRANEEFRYLSEGKKLLLYNYNRTLNSRFDGTLVSISKNQLKLGLTTDTTLSYRLSDNQKYLLFVRDGALWEYDMNTNIMIRVYGNSVNGKDFARYDNREHDFKLISLDDEGNADFVYFGYIPRGEYEGRVGILYYRFYAGERRLEEMMFVPVTVPYSILKEEFGAFTYCNSYDEFYFTLYDTLYLYRTLVNDFSIVAENLSEQWVYFENEQLLVYQEDAVSKDNCALHLYDLENRAYTKKTAPDGQRIVLLGTIDNRIVYGLAREEDITFYEDGKDCVPLYQLTIEELSGLQVETYAHENKYIADARVNGNVISIDLCQKVGTVTVTTVDAEGTETSRERPIFKDAGEDIILNIREKVEEPVTISSRTTDLMHKEYYINLPASYRLESIPKSTDTVFTVITGNTSARMDGWLRERYYVVAFGKIYFSGTDFGQAVATADRYYGSVFDSKGKVVWKRGCKALSATLRNFEKTFSHEGLSVEHAVLQMFFNNKGAGTDAALCNLDEKSFLDWMSGNVPGRAVSFSGVKLSQVLNFISDGRPVAARFGNRMIMLIGYSSSLITYVDPGLGKTYTKDLKEVQEMLGSGTVYYTYIE